MPESHSHFADLGSTPDVTKPRAHLPVNHTGGRSIKWIDWYNPTRLHGEISHIQPLEHEANWHTAHLRRVASGVEEGANEGLERETVPLCGIGRYQAPIDVYLAD